MPALNVANEYSYSAASWRVHQRLAEGQWVRENRRRETESRHSGELVQYALRYV